MVMSMLKTILKLVGWQKLFLMVWDIVYPELDKLCKKSERTQVDDRVLAAVNEIVLIVLKSGYISKPQ